LGGDLREVELELAKHGMGVGGPSLGESVVTRKVARNQVYGSIEGMRPRRNPVLARWQRRRRDEQGID
jgi:hypothetical protein